MGDIRDRVMADKPEGFLHKLAGIVPGFNGYMDRERRRDADKLLRTYLAHQYSAQRDRLTRVQQSLLRAGQITGISEVERLNGVLQRFIDRLNTATYGYSGMFDPVTVQAQDLDQLYAFDMALTSGVDDVSSAIGAIESATTAETAKTDVPTALSHLSSVLDDLNLRLNQRSDLLTSGKGLPTDQYNSLVNSFDSTSGTGSGSMSASSQSGMTYPPPPPPMPPAPPAPGATPYTAAPPQYSAGTPSTSGGAPTVDTSGGETARYSGGSQGYSDSSGGSDAGSTSTPSGVPPYPSGNYTGGGMSSTGGSDTTDLTGGATDSSYGINSASSPSSGPTGQTGQASDIADDTSSGNMPSSGAMDSDTNADATDLSDMPSNEPKP